ncbi:nucleotidyltransferase family protein [candidate division KSB1 bacterium]|nr:nucleotidyltransferase family protein [candidate division KSB1 bacterium]
MMLLDRELDIILLLLKRYLRPAVVPPLKIEAAVDWERLLRIASFHRVTPLVYRGLKEIDTVPSAILERFRQIVVLQSVINVRAAANLKLLLRHFYQRDIAVVPLKGHVLGAELYDDVAVRSSVDHDLYVPKKQIGESVELLSELGYSSALLQHSSVRQALARFHTLEFLNPATGARVDLHVDLTDGYISRLIPRNDPGRSTRLFHFEDEPIRIFDEDITAALIAVHGAKDSWAYLSAWMDLALFFRRYPQISYLTILKMLQQRGVARMLYIGASLVERFFDVEAPMAIRQSSDYRSIELSRRISHRLLRDPFRQADGGWTKVLLNLQFREKWSEKLRYLYFKSLPKKVDMAESAQRPSILRHVKRVLHQGREEPGAGRDARP